MNFLNKLGLVAVASRLKRITDLFYYEGAKVYKGLNINFQPKWFTIFKLLSYTKKPMSIMEIAKELKISHPAVIKIVKSMLKEDILLSKKDKSDARKHLIILSEKGKKLDEILSPLWDSFDECVQTLFDNIGYDVIDFFNKVENSFGEKVFSESIIKNYKLKQFNNVEIVDFKKEYKKYFEAFNNEWLEKYFKIEEYDKRILKNPENEIINKDGYIFFAKLGTKIIGTVALLKIDSHSFEIAKMSVTKKHQGKQAGKKLVIYVLEKAYSEGAKKVYLKTDKKLFAAINLYRKLGFKIFNPKKIIKPQFNREICGLSMELDLLKWKDNKKKKDKSKLNNFLLI